MRSETLVTGSKCIRNWLFWLLLPFAIMYLRGFYLLLNMSYFFLILLMVRLDIFCSNPLKILVKTRNFKLKLGKNIKNTLQPIKHFQKYFMAQQSFYYLINKLMHKKMKTLSPSFSSAIPSLPKQNVFLDCFFLYIYYDIVPKIWLFRCWVITFTLLSQST